MSESILDHHLLAFGARDVDAILEDYTEDSTIIIPKSVIKGLDEIRELYVTYRKISGKRRVSTQRSNVPRDNFSTNSNRSYLGLINLDFAE